MNGARCILFAVCVLILWVLLCTSPGRFFLAILLLLFTVSAAFVFFLGIVAALPPFHKRTARTRSMRRVPPLRVADDIPLSPEDRNAIARPIRDVESSKTTDRRSP